MIFKKLKHFQNFNLTLLFYYYDKLNVVGIFQTKILNTWTRNNIFTRGQLNKLKLIQFERSFAKKTDEGKWTTVVLDKGYTDRMTEILLYYVFVCVCETEEDQSTIN